MDQRSQPPQELMGIKEVAERTGLPASTIRYYDQQFSDYLGVKRGAGRRRLFTPQAVERLLQLQRMLKEEGLSLRQVRQKISGPLPAADPATPPPAELNRCLQEIDEMRDRLNSLEKQVAELKEIQQRTLSLVDRLTRV